MCFVRCEHTAAGDARFPPPCPAERDGSRVPYPGVPDEQLHDAAGLHDDA